MPPPRPGEGQPRRALGEGGRRGSCVTSVVGMLPKRGKIITPRSSAELHGSSLASPHQAQDVGWTLCLSKVGGHLFQPSPEGFWTQGAPCTRAGHPAHQSELSGSQQWDRRRLPASLELEQSCRGWDKDVPPTPQPGLGRDAPAPQRPQ